jgi:hypothetical protein
VKPPLLRFFLLFVVIPPLILPLLACGKKGPPRLVAYEKPESPSGLNALRRWNEIILGWEHRMKRDVEEYVVLRKGDGDFDRVASLGGDLFIDRDVAPGMAYGYRIRARDIRGLLSSASEALVAGPDAGLLTPVGLSFAIRHDSVSISWEYPEGGVLFNVYRTMEGGRYPLLPLNPEPLAESSMEDKTYFMNTVSYSVRAVKLDPGVKVTYEGPASDDMSVRPVDYVASAPTGLKAVRTDKKVVVIWHESPEAWVRGYAVYRAVEEGERERIGVSDTPAFSDPDAPVGGLTYWVRAMSPAVEGTFSEPVTLGFSEK